MISQIARFLTGEISRSASVGVAGETASGKSTITLDTFLSGILAFFTNSIIAAATAALRD